MNSEQTSPIGIFDSGIGGLTVAHAIKKLLPNETMIYFGDTAHLPYGDKSEATVQACSIKITDVLLKKGCKVIIIACNSASSAAYELLKEYTGKRAKVINVIDPMIAYIKEHFKGNKLGLIGTKRTVKSNVYAKKIKLLRRDIQLASRATPLLAPMIEEGFYNNEISHEIIEKYLSVPGLSDLDALILACTHYPLIKNQINDFYGGKVEILDSSEITAKYLKQYLTEYNLMANTPGNDSFFVSDYTASFEASTKIFFKKLVHLEKYPLWE